MKAFMTGVLVFVMAAAAWAGPLDDANGFYKAGRWQDAVNAYQQALPATEKSKTETAKIYYKMGLAEHHLKQDDQATSDYQQAQTLDPTLSFASSPQKFQEAVARSNGSSGSSTTGTGTLTSDPNGRDAAYQALTAGTVYLDPQLGLGSEAQTTLAQAAMQGNENPHTFVKIALLKSLPSGFRSLGDYAGKLHRTLNLGKNGLVVVVASGQAAGVEVVTTGLSAQENASLAQKYAPQISNNPVQGTVALSQALASDINNHERRGADMIWLVFLVVIIVLGVLIGSAMRQKKQQMVAMRVPIDALRENVLSGIEYLDGYVDVLPKNNPDSDQVRAYRQAASAKFDQAAKILDHSTETSDLQRAQGLLDRAQADVEQARRYLDRATGGTGNIPGDDAMRPKPLPESESQVQAIPANQRGVSFFSSQPAPIGSLVPVTVTINGQSRQVLVTPEEAEEMRQGRMPQVRAFQQGGRYVPWYEYSNYDPYRDYWGYQNSGWGGFGTGVVAGLVGAELIDDLFAPRYGGGYSPYAFATDDDYYRGYSDAIQSNQAAGFGFNNYDNSGGGGFLNNDGPGYDTQGYDNAGGASFLNDGGGYGNDQS